MSSAPTPPEFSAFPSSTPDIPQAPKAFNIGSNEESGNSDGWQTFRTFLGKEGFKKFMDGLCQSINRQIQQEEKKMREANRKLKKAELGEDDD